MKRPSVLLTEQNQATMNHLLRSETICLDKGNLEDEQKESVVDIM